MSEFDDIYDKDQVTLTLDDDTEVVCDVIGIFPGPEDREYIALVPQSQADEEDPEIYLYRFYENPEDEEDIRLDNIESDEEFEAAAKAYDDFMAEEFLLDEEDEE